MTVLLLLLLLLLLLADRKYKEKEQRGRFGEIDEKISRGEYTLDWSQSKVFLVLA